MLLVVGVNISVILSTHWDVSFISEHMLGDNCSLISEHALGDVSVIS